MPTSPESMLFQLVASNQTKSRSLLLPSQRGFLEWGSSKPKESQMKEAEVEDRIESRGLSGSRRSNQAVYFGTYIYTKAK